MAASEALQRAIQDAQAGRLDAALASVRMLAKRRPDDLEAIAVLGLLLMQAGQLDQAIHHLSRAVALAPHLADPGRSAEAAVWAARLLVSYFLHPSPAVDLTDEAHVRRLVTTHLLPGLAPERPVPVPPKPLTTRSTRP